jgi:hypothetical protein
LGVTGPITGVAPPGAQIAYRVAVDLVLIDHHEVTVGQRGELREVAIVGGVLDIELGAHHAGRAHDPRHDVGVAPAVPERVGHGVAAAGQGGDGRIERLARPDVDSVVPDQVQRGRINAHPDIVVAVVLVDERNRDVAVGQARDRGRVLVSVVEPAELDVAADLVACNVVALPEDGGAVGVMRPPAVGPGHDVAAVEQADDPAVVPKGIAAGRDRCVR